MNLFKLWECRKYINICLIGFINEMRQKVRYNDLEGRKRSTNRVTNTFRFSVYNSELIIDYFATVKHMKCYKTIKSMLI